MQYYFPYCSIIAGVETQSVTKHTYTGDWQIIRKPEEPSSSPKPSSISELYY